MGKRLRDARVAEAVKRVSHLATSAARGPADASREATLAILYKLLHAFWVADKPLVWWGSSLDDVRAFSNEARREVGFQLRRVQPGLAPSDWKPMTTVGPGVIAIRIHTTEEYRVFSVAKFAKPGYVVRAFHHPRISDLMRGKIRLFSVDSLIEMLGHAGAHVSVTVKQQRRQVAERATPPYCCPRADTAEPGKSR